jgi:CBS domain-containing protein
LKVEEKLQEIQQKLNEGSQGEIISVRDFLAWFDAKRRGIWVVSSVRRYLDSFNLETSPDFESAYIDSDITIRFKDASGDTSVVVEQTERELVGGYDSDPTYRISKLAAANTTPTWVFPQQTLSEAITLMMANGFSQLPVMSGERDVKGIVSWKTIGTRLALKKVGTQVSEFIEPVKVVSNDSSIFSVIEDITQGDCVLVKDYQNKISGIITTADLSEQFGVLSRPFLILGEIENYIRKLLDNRYTKEQLIESVDPNDSERKIESVSDLTFGEYLRIIENQKRWAALKLEVDRKMFISKLDKVRSIRNSVMHFDPDGVDQEEMATLNQFCEFLRALNRCGALEN